MKLNFEISKLALEDLNLFGNIRLNSGLKNKHTNIITRYFR
jgi:hypothetical protein